MVDIRISFKKTLFLLFALLSIIFSVFSCKNENQSPLVLRIGHPMAEGTNVALGYEKFRDLVKEKSNGKIVIKIYPNALLGNDLATMKAVQNGELEMASSSTPNLEGISNKFTVFDLPYIVQPENQEKLYQSLDTGELGVYIDEISAENGLKPVMISEYGYRNFTTISKPLKNPEDIRGLKIRTTQSSIEIEVAHTLGAIPVSLLWADTYPALIRRTIDGEGNTFSLLHSAGHHKMLRYVTLTKHNYSMHILMINKKLWDGLDSGAKRIISESAKEALRYEREASITLEENAMKMMEQSGVKIIKTTPDERKRWIKAVKPVWDKKRSEFPEKLVNLIMDSQK